MNGINIALPEDAFPQIAELIPLGKKDNSRLFSEAGSMFSVGFHVVLETLLIDFGGSGNCFRTVKVYDMPSAMQ